MKREKPVTNGQMPVFKGTGGHIHCIEAASLKPWIADVGGWQSFYKP